MNSFSRIPVMTKSGRVKHRHYTITIHALNRYVERTGSELSSMITDIDSAWVFYVGSNSVHAKYRYIAHKAEMVGGYLLTNGYLLFIVIPRKSHRVITVLLM